MGFIINAAFFIVAWFAGYFICVFGIVSPVTVLRTSIPLTKYLRKKGLIDAAGANGQSAFTLFLWVSIDVVVVVLLLKFASTLIMTGFSVGAGIAFLFGIGQTGPNNPNNIKDFVGSYHRHLKQEYLIEALDAINDYPLLRRWER